MPQMSRLSTYRTTIASRNGNTCITYHNTVVVEFDNENVILRSGGYETVTTKRKMNQAANQFGLGFGVHQIKGAWFVTRHGRSPEGYPSAAPEHGAVTFPFHDGIRFPRGAVH